MAIRMINYLKKHPAVLLSVAVGYVAVAFLVKHVSTPKQAPIGQGAELSSESGVGSVQERYQAIANAQANGERQYHFVTKIPPSLQ